MQQNNFERRISTSEAEINNIKSMIIDIKNLLTESARDRQKNHSEIIQRLTRVEINQDSFKEYQESCDAERSSISSRVSNIENDRSRESGKSTVISALLGALSGALVALATAWVGRGS